jgi:hypothetical protein
MKFRFEAIDERGTVIRHVLRADSEDNARETLLAEGIFPKRIEPAPEDEKVSWSPRAAARQLQQRVHAQGQPNTSEPQTRQTLHATLHRGNQTHRGTLTTRSDNSILFQSGDFEILIHPDKVETARVAGFPLRTLRIAMLDGELLEFPSGLLFANPTFKRIAKSLAKS